MTKTPLSVVIPTKNEEANICQCLESVAWADELIVFDSYSDDGTTEIAESLGARIIRRPFDNFSAHKNWALKNIDFKHPWILIVDADERISDVLAREIQQLLASEPDKCGYYIARQNLFCGRWIRHGGWYPDWQLRLMRPEVARYEDRIVHEHILLDGPAGYLTNHLIHHDYKGIERYFDRHNTYSSMEAVEACGVLRAEANRQGGIGASLFSKGPEKRRFIKNLAYRYLPCRPLFKFLWMYVVKMGFLDGRMGFRFCLLHTFYEYQISLKLEELGKPNSPIRRKYGQYLVTDDE